MPHSHHQQTHSRHPSAQVFQQSSPKMLQEHLQREIVSREALLSCLKTERAAMEQQDNERLLVSVEEKNQILQELEQLVRTRQSMVADLPGLRKKLQPLATSSEDARRICAYCECLHSLSEDIVRSNEINGRLNARGQQIIRRLLSILRGQDNHADLYNQQGQAAQQHGGQSFYQA